MKILSFTYKFVVCLDLWQIICKENKNRSPVPKKILPLPRNLCFFILYFQVRIIVLENLTIAQLVKHFPNFYKTRKFITALKRAP